jgi:hypothetical protein
MGSRTTWEIRTHADSPSIYLYSHWGGESKWVDTVRALSAAEPRWSDPTYAARIFISQIVGEYWSAETGFGITAGNAGELPFEESYFSVVVNFESNSLVAGNTFYSFSEFLATEDAPEFLREKAWS